MSQKQESYFWTSYSDLMTSLFFVMLVLFVLACAMLNNKIDEVEKQKTATEMELAKIKAIEESFGTTDLNKLKEKLLEVEKQKEATEKELAKIREIEESIEAIDPNFFEYNSKHKKHILKINVQFKKGSSNIADIPSTQQTQLINAGKSISKFLRNSSDDVRYLLIIEGQSSKDDYPGNDVLSYDRANSLRHFWNKNNIDFSSKCEVIVSGSGQNGVMRALPDDKNNEKNQRFLIHIIPKPGVIDRIENENANKKETKTHG